MYFEITQTQNFGEKFSQTKWEPAESVQIQDDPNGFRHKIQALLYSNTAHKNTV